MMAASQVQPSIRPDRRLPGGCGPRVIPLNMGLVEIQKQAKAS